MASNLSGLTDEELASRVQTGSPRCFEELAVRYRHRLYNFLRARLPSTEDAEDLVQDTLLKVLRNIDRYDPDRCFSTWLYTAAFRLAISYHRSKNVRRKESLPVAAPADPGLIFEKEEARRNLWETARGMAPRKYEALWLRYVEDMPVKEMARVLGRTPMAVRLILYRARLELADRFSPDRKRQRRGERLVSDHVPCEERIK